jgi:nicotinamidase-related amidase
MWLYLRHQKLTENELPKEDTMAKRTALLIVDVQKGLFDESYPEDRVILDKIETLLSKARETNTPVIYMQHDGGPEHPLHPGVPEWEIAPRVAPREGDLVFGKHASDSFYETLLDETLKKLGVTRLVVTGAMTQFCVDATCRRAASLEYDVVLVGDGHLTSDNGILKAEQIVAHHNRLLAQLAHPTHPIQVQPAAEVQLQ